MKRFSLIITFWVLLFILFPVQPVSAQHGDYPPPPADAWKGQVSGKIVNQTSGETLKEPVDVMLHAWDPDNQERMMLHGKADEKGVFLFDEVDLHQDFSYSVMSTYEGATYFSDLAHVQKGETTFTVDASVYDTTDDLSNLSIDQLHVLFYIEDGKFGVTQFYELSNSGKFTVKDTVTLPRDRTGTLKFHLPEEAENVKFGNDSGGRYVLLPGAFADTAPVPPGDGVSQVIVAYNLSFSGKLDYSYLAPLPVKSVSFLVLESSGLTLESGSLTPDGVRTMQDGSKFEVYTAPSLSPGESIQLTLSGKPGTEAVLNSTPAQNTANTGTMIGAGALGLSLLVAGVWWWKRREEEDKETGEELLEGILEDIQSLDQAFERGEILEKEYRENRAELRERLKVASSSVYAPAELEQSTE